MISKGESGKISSVEQKSAGTEIFPAPIVIRWPND